MHACSREYPHAKILLAAQQRYPKRLRKFLRQAKDEFQVVLMAAESATHCKLFRLELNERSAL
jgi:hypothetical protein